MEGWWFGCPKRAQSPEGVEAQEVAEFPPARVLLAPSVGYGRPGAECGSGVVGYGKQAGETGRGRNMQEDKQKTNISKQPNI